jgi:ATP-dependent helicase HrpA
LPVEEARERIAAAIAAHPITIICGETGSGKTTQIPKICLALGRGVAGAIGCTQPRRIAARSVAQRIAQELDSEVGQQVGWKVRFTDRVSERTCIKVMTDGVLLAEIHEDRFLSAYDTLIIDEAHERSLNIDFLLGYLAQLLPRRPDLKVVITSATLEADRLSRHFGGAPVIEVSGRTYPVELRWRPIAAAETGEERDARSALLAAVDELAALSHEGDILVFLPGEREIREAAEALRHHHPPHTEILPLFARLSVQEQDRVFRTGGARRIVLSTNVAETSLTVPGIRYVVDTGLARVNRYSVRNKVTQLQIEKISQAAARQRAGRCGRVAAGVCIRLYDELDHDARPPYTTPEILRSSLAGVILRMQSLRLGRVEDYPFIDAPAPKMIEDGYLLLHELGAVDGERALTVLGREMARLPVDPRIARMLLAGRDFNSLAEILVLAAALSIQDPRERPAEHRQAADERHRQFAHEHSDFVALINLWVFCEQASERLSQRKLQALCRENFLSFNRVREWRDVYNQLHALVNEMGIAVNGSPATFEQVHRALLAGLLGQIGSKDPESDEYLGGRGIRFVIAPGSPLTKARPRWIMAAEIADTTRLYARHVARIEPDWIEPAAAHLTRRSYFDPVWDRKAAQASIHEQVTLYGLTLVARRRIRLGPVDPFQARELFIRHALVAAEWDCRAPFFQHNQALVREVEALEHKARRQDVLVDERVLAGFYDGLLPADAWSGERFEKWRREVERATPRLLFMVREQLMRHAADAITPDLFPVLLRVGSHEFPLTYRFEPGHPLDGVTLTLPLLALGQLDDGALSWLVPGMVRDKVTALLRGLPQRIRRHFVPLPQAVTEFLSVAQIGDGHLEDCLRRFVEQRGEALPADFSWTPLLPHLQFNVRLLGEQREELGLGRDIAALRRQFSVEARSALTGAAEDRHSRSGLTSWDFDELPEDVEIRRGGRVFRAYPALCADGASVSLQLMEDMEAAHATMGGGLVRLAECELHTPIRALLKQLPEGQAMGLLYAVLPAEDGTPAAAGTLAPAEELRADIVSRALMSLLPDQPWTLRTRAAWTAWRTEVQRALPATARDLAALVHEILLEHQRVRDRLEKPWAHHLKPACAEVRLQMAGLVGRGFVRRLPRDRLRELPRYLRAAAVRLLRLPDAWQQDGERSLQVELLAREWRAALARQGPSPDLDEFRWLLEELRVSLFAQELKTPFPVSPKRLQKRWEELRASKTATVVRR